MPCCHRELQEKLDRAERLMTQLVRLQFPATALVLLRFCLGWCQMSYHARAMPPRQHAPLRPNNADFSQELPRRSHPSRHHPRGLAPGTSFRQKMRFRHQSSRSPFPGSLLGVKQQHNLRATRTQRYLSNLCDKHTPDTLMEQSSQGDRISLELHQVIQAGGRPRPPSPFKGTLQGFGTVTLEGLPFVTLEAPLEGSPLKGYPRGLQGCLERERGGEGLKKKGRRASRRWGGREGGKRR